MDQTTDRGIRVALFPACDGDGPEVVIHCDKTKRQVSIEFEHPTTEVAPMCASLIVTAIDENMKYTTGTHGFLNVDWLDDLCAWLRGEEPK